MTRLLLSLLPFLSLTFFVLSCSGAADPVVKNFYAAKEATSSKFYTANPKIPVSEDAGMVKATDFALFTEGGPAGSITVTAHPDFIETDGNGNRLLNALNPIVITQLAKVKDTKVQYDIFTRLAFPTNTTARDAIPNDVAEAMTADNIIKSITTLRKEETMSYVEENNSVFRKSSSIRNKMCENFNKIAKVGDYVTNHYVAMHLACNGKRLMKGSNFVNNTNLVYSVDAKTAPKQVPMADILAGKYEIGIEGDSSTSVALYIIIAVAVVIVLILLAFVIYKVCNKRRGSSASV